MKWQDQGIDRAVLNVNDYEQLADEALEGPLRDYIAGGAGDEVTVRENLEAFGSWRFRPRALVDVSRVDTRASVLGHELSMPILVAPLAFQGVVHPDGEIACAQGAGEQGTVTCVSTFGSFSPSQVAAAAPAARIWPQLYVLRDQGLTRSLVDGAVESGATAIVLTVDAPRLGRRERDQRSGFTIAPSTPIPALEGVERGATSIEALFDLVDPAVTWTRLEELAGTSPIPIVVKGLLTGEDAHLACEHGAAAVVVSNHGGRQLDGALASLDALPEVVRAVEGRAEVYLDGGVRRGGDVAKALALGADAVLVGRPVLWALAARGRAGVSHVLGMLRDELELTLALLGCTNVGDVTRDHVVRLAELR